ncbi:MAG: hypothetical protein ABF271_14695 [Abyssibacter sp.]|jgi:hypothetical protein|uniref:hypothetical protein n=1 Tax=Abyssibacter sp. TaxID=2320200 RepID=UPI00321AFF19
MTHLASPKRKLSIASWSADGQTTNLTGQTLRTPVSSIVCCRMDSGADSEASVNLSNLFVWI